MHTRNVPFNLVYISVFIIFPEMMLKNGIKPSFQYRYCKINIGAYDFHVLDLINKINQVCTKENRFVSCFHLSRIIVMKIIICPSY